MKENQLAHLKRVLKRRLGETEEVVEHEEAINMDELPNGDTHPADSASDLVIQTTEMAIEELLEEEVADIKAALQAMEDGTYGVCEVCEKKIPYERLEALPTARTCIEHAK